MLARLHSVLLCQSFTGFLFLPYTSTLLFLWQEFFISVITPHVVFSVFLLLFLLSLGEKNLEEWKEHSVWLGYTGAQILYLSFVTIDRLLRLCEMVVLFLYGVVTRINEIYTHIHNNNIDRIQQIFNKYQFSFLFPLSNNPVLPN